jgi:hypothetical protein
MSSAWNGITNPALRRHTSFSGLWGLLDHAEQRPAPQRLRRPRLARATVYHRDHLVAKCLEFGVVNAAELHPKVKGSYRDQMGGIPIAPGGQCGPAFFKSCEDREQLFI